MIKGPRNFDDKKVNKKTFYKDKNAYDVYDVDNEKILVSKKESYRHYPYSIFCWI